MGPQPICGRPPAQKTGELREGRTSGYHKSYVTSNGDLARHINVFLTSYVLGPSPLHSRIGRGDGPFSHFFWTLTEPLRCRSHRNNAQGLEMSGARMIRIALLFSTLLEPLKKCFQVVPELPMSVHSALLGQMRRQIPFKKSTKNHTNQDSTRI